MDPDTAQENIAYARALNSEHQLELLNTLASNFASNEYRLLIIDSIMACFRVDYCGRGELADRQQKLNQFLSKLTHMAEEFNVCVLMVRFFPSLVREGSETDGWGLSRLIKSNPILVQMRFSLVLMGENLLVGISWLTRRLQGCF